MGWGSDPHKLGRVSAEQKWDYINLSDFRSASCFTYFSYGILYVAFLVSLTCYAVDIFTAVNLLIFDRWNGQIQPVIPFTISRWIFAGCIILSWVLLLVRWMRAIRAIRSGGVAQSYLDPLAFRTQSVRMGKTGRGWRRFLLFAELTKSKKGSEYVALFTYFSFEAWLRIVFAEGPRNVINAMTLYSVMQANLVPTGKHAPSNNGSQVSQFFANIKILYDSNHIGAVVLFGMLYTLVIWVVAALCLAIACIFYVTFLWHHIPSHDNGLSGFCKRKIDRRLQKIVRLKVNKALAKTSTMPITKGSQPSGSTDESRLGIKRQPTLPDLTNSNDDRLPEMPMLSRQTTQTSLPPYSSRPPTRNEDPIPPAQRQPTIPDVSLDSIRPHLPSRSNTNLSAVSDASNAPLIGSAVDMGYGDPGRSYSPAPMSRIGSERTIQGRPSHLHRTTTNGSRASQQSSTAYREDQFHLSRRQNTDATDSDFSGAIISPPARQNTSQSTYPNAQSTANPLSRKHTGSSIQHMHERTVAPHPTFDTRDRRQLLGTSPFNSRGKRRDRRGPHQGFEWSNETFEMRPPTSSHYLQRSFTAQGGSFSRPTPPQRSGTAPLPHFDTYEDTILDAYGNDEPAHRMPIPPMPHRAATASPSGGDWNPLPRQRRHDMPRHPMPNGSATASPGRSYRAPPNQFHYQAH